MLSEGVWQPARIEHNGTALTEPAYAVSKIRLAVRDRRRPFTGMYPGQPERWHQFRTESWRNPKWIDVSSPNGTGTSRGIYSLDRDTLTFCAPATPGERPAMLDSKGGQLLIVFRRVGE